MVLPMKCSTQRDKIVKSSSRHRSGITLFEISLFSMLGAIMFISKKLMEFLPNMHLLGVFIVAFTVVYRKKALIPIYIYVFLDGLFGGFGMWWFPYLYIWTILWAVTMLLPRNLSTKYAVWVYPLLCAVHGFLFGILYAPAQMLMFSLSFKQTLLWVMAGIPFDITHGVSNFLAGLLALPVSLILRKLNSSVPSTFISE